MDFNALVTEASSYFTKCGELINGLQNDPEQLSSCQQDYQTIQNDLKQAYESHDENAMQEAHNVIIEFYEYLQQLNVNVNPVQTDTIEQPEQPQVSQDEQEHTSHEEVVQSEIPADLKDFYVNISERFNEAKQHISSDYETKTLNLVANSITLAYQALNNQDYQNATDLLNRSASQLKLIEVRQGRASDIKQQSLTFTNPTVEQPIREKTEEDYRNDIKLRKGEFRSLRDRLPLSSLARPEYKKALQYQDTAYDYEIDNDFINASKAWTLALDTIKVVLKNR